jgi:hypothetical protein
MLRQHRDVLIARVRGNDETVGDRKAALLQPCAVIGFATYTASIGFSDFVECFQRRLHTSRPTRTIPPRTIQVVGLTVASQDPTVSVER